MIRNILLLLAIVATPTYAVEVVYQPTADNLDGDETADDTTATSFANDWVDVRSDASAATRSNGLVVFPSVSIPAGATIDSAKLQVYGGTAQGIQATIYGEDVDSSADLTTTADINGRTKTTANVAWDTASWTIDDWNDSPDITSVIQEIYDRNSQIDGNNVGIILEAGTVNARLGRFNAYPNPDGTAFAAKLVVNYTASSGASIPVILHHQRQMRQ